MRHNYAHERDKHLFTDPVMATISVIVRSGVEEWTLQPVPKTMAVESYASPQEPEHTCCASTCNLSEGALLNSQKQNGITKSSFGQNRIRSHHMFLINGIHKPNERHLVEVVYCGKSWNRTPKTCKIITLKNRSGSLRAICQMEISGNFVMCSMKVSNFGCNHVFTKNLLISNRIEDTSKHPAFYILWLFCWIQYCHEKCLVE